MDPVGQAMPSWGSIQHTYLVIPTVDGPANSFTKRMGRIPQKIMGWWWWCWPAFSSGDSDFAGASTVCLKDQNISKPLSPPTSNIWGCWGLVDSPVAEACNQKSPAWVASSRNPGSIQKVRELRVPPSLDIQRWSVFWVQRTSFVGGLAVELHWTADFKISYTCGITYKSFSQPSIFDWQAIPVTWTANTHHLMTLLDAAIMGYTSIRPHWQSQLVTNHILHKAPIIWWVSYVHRLLFHMFCWSESTYCNMLLQGWSSPNMCMWLVVWNMFYFSIYWE